MKTRDRAAYMREYHLRHREEAKLRRKAARDAVCSNRKAWHALHVILMTMTRDERWKFFLRFLAAMKRHNILVRMGVRKRRDSL